MKKIDYAAYYRIEAIALKAGLSPDRARALGERLAARPLPREEQVKLRAAAMRDAPTPEVIKRVGEFRCGGVQNIVSDTTTTDHEEDTNDE
jgi:hypothetical protein